MLDGQQVLAPVALRAVIPPINDIPGAPVIGVLREILEDPSTKQLTCSGRMTYLPLGSIWVATASVTPIPPTDNEQAESRRASEAFFW